MQGAVRFERTDATCLVGEAMGHAETAACLHCALEATQKEFLVVHVESQDGVPFVGAVDASWDDLEPVSLGLLLPCPRLPPHPRHRRLLHACPQSPEGPCVRVRRHTVSH